MSGIKKTVIFLNCEKSIKISFAGEKIQQSSKVQVCAAADVSQQVTFNLHLLSSLSLMLATLERNKVELRFLLAEQTEGQTAWMGEQNRLVRSQWLQWERRWGRRCILRDGALQGGGGCLLVCLWAQLLEQKERAEELHGGRPEWHQTAAGPPAASHTSDSI